MTGGRFPGRSEQAAMANRSTDMLKKLIRERPQI